MKSKPKDNYKAFVRSPRWMVRDHRVSAEARLLFIILKSFCFKGDECWPGPEKLAQYMNCSRSKVFRLIRELIGNNWIARRPSDPAKHRSYPIYKMLDVAIEKRQQKLANPERSLVSPVTPKVVSPVTLEVEEKGRGLEKNTDRCAEVPENVIQMPNSKRKYTLKRKPM